MNRKIKIKLGDVLVKSGKITSFDLSQALNEQKGTGKKLGEILIELGLVTEEDIIECLKKQLEIERINLDDISFDKRALKLLNENICEKHVLIPFGFENNKIKVAIWDPLNIFAIDDVYISTGYEVKCYLSSKQQISSAIKRYYSTEQVLKAAETLSNEKRQEKNIQNSEYTEQISDIKNAPVVKMVDLLISDAVAQRASDIHIEPFEDEVIIRYRIDGELRRVNSLSINTLSAIVTRIKILSDLNIAEKRIPQDGRIITKIGEKELDIRVSILPVITGEKVVMRILSKEFFNAKKEELGMDNYNLNMLNNIITNPHGIILVTGPTGSGKSTTLYTILNELNSGNLNIITIEDPVEATIKGVNQVNVNNKAGLTFASGLRSILRQDPDIVMIGEIRDKETAEIAIRAAITGHLVLSTIHTNDAPSTMLRLIDMGIEPYLVANSVVGVVAQRLVKTICPKCGYEYKGDNYEKNLLDIDERQHLILRKGRGCEYCSYSGYSGRTGIYEIINISSEHISMILNSKDINEFKELCMKKGMKTLREACTELVLQGKTTLEQLSQVVFIKE